MNNLITTCAQGTIATTDALCHINRLKLFQMEQFNLVGNSFEFHPFCWAARRGYSDCTRSTMRNNRMVERGEKIRQIRLGIYRKLVLNDFHIFLYEVPHLLLIAEIKSVFFSVRRSLPEIFRHISVAKKDIQAASS